MRVFQLSTGDEPLTQPKRQAFGITFALRGGDVCHPLGQGDWFKPPYFSRVLRFWSYFPLPFITWNLCGWRGYAGMKCWGCDSEAYKNWLPAEIVYPGSIAMQLSLRLRITD